MAFRPATAPGRGSWSALADEAEGFPFVGRLVDAVGVAGEEGGGILVVGVDACQARAEAGSGGCAFEFRARFARLREEEEG